MFWSIQQCLGPWKSKRVWNCEVFIAEIRWLKMAFDRRAQVKMMMLSTLLLIVVYEIATVKRVGLLTTKTERILSISVVYNRTLANSSLVDGPGNGPRPLHIWPREPVETNDRISNQLEFVASLNLSGKSSHASNLKLIYHVPHINYGDPSPEGQHIFTAEQCHVQACSLTRRPNDLKNADAVYIESFEASMLKTFLPKPKKQVWIIFGIEPPPLTSEMKLFDSVAIGNLVNWTMVYRRDATIPIPYGKFETFPNFTRIEDYRLSGGVNYAAGRTKKVAWFVSNCNYGINSGRDNYAAELAKYIDIDIYGRCGKLKCPKEDMPGCLLRMKKDYKFYLAFENNCCRDYITEKLFSNALRIDVIPIVLGAHPDDYKALAPPGSYIHVDDFESPKQLADYLHLLDKNDTLYNEYFRWKKTGTFISTQPWCRLCALLHANDDGSYVHWYPDFHKWWEEDMCLEKSKPGHWQSWRNKKRR